MAEKQHETRDIYVIPPNYTEAGAILGGMLKLRNAVEAGILALAVGLPVFSISGLSLTTRIIIICLTALPLAMIALIGISGESLSSFAVIFYKYLKNKRIVGAVIEDSSESTIPQTRQRKKPRTSSSETKRRKESDFAAEFDEVDWYDMKNRRRSRKIASSPKPQVERKTDETKPKEKAKPRPRYLNPVAAYIPIEKIANGIIYTKDHRYVKIIEVEPINFLLRSAREQRNIIYSFVSYLKISPVKMQFKVMTKSANINKHLETVKKEMENETDPHCRALQEDYAQLIREIGSQEAITRRFFIIFEYEALNNIRRGDDEADAIAALQTTVQTATNYLRQCGNDVLAWDNDNEFTVDVLYNLLNRQTSIDLPLSDHVNEVYGKYSNAGEGYDPENIPATEFVAPRSIDFSHGKYIIIDDVYYAYLLVPSDGYKPQVPAGWMSLLVNAGDGIDLDVFFTKQPKERIIQKLGQQIRINRSKIKETSDTNTDFDDLDGAIRSGYYLKEGLSNNEDLYYMNTLITITASSQKELEWKTSEIKKLLLSQDMNVVSCSYREEQAFLSALPMIAIEKKLYERSKRNILTSGVASCYPFSSFELCDDNGILLGINKYNNSMLIADTFNTKLYKNANISILGASGSGKTFTMQLMASRMRRKGIQVFILPPLKGHEFRRACQNIGGEFIQISPASKNCINIMEIRRIDKSVEELLDGPMDDRSELAAKIQKLHIFFALLIPDMNYEEKQLLDEAIIRTYNLKGITHNNDSLADTENPDSYREMPLLGDLYALLLESSETKRLANILNRLVNGSASTFNQHTNVSLDNKYTVIDISDLSGDLLAVGMFVGLDYMWDKAKEDRTKEKCIFIPEAWKLIGASSNALTASYVLEMAKVIRGYGGGLVVDTQDINDFFSLEDGKYGRGIINACKTKIILNMEDNEAQQVQSILNLSETEVMEITHFDRGSALVMTNSNNVTVDIKCSQLEKDLITTDRRELQELVSRKRQAAENHEK